MGIYDQLQTISTHSPTPKVTPKPKERKPVKAKKETTNDQSVGQSTDQLTNQHTSQPVSRPTDQPTHQLADFDELGPVVEKSRAFYITEKVDRWLDEAVRYLQEKGLYKVDRSVLLNALLHKPEFYKPDSLDRLRNQLLAHLTNKTLKRA